MTLGRNICQCFPLYGTRKTDRLLLLHGEIRIRNSELDNEDNFYECWAMYSGVAMGAIFKFKLQLSVAPWISSVKVIDVSSRDVLPPLAHVHIINVCLQNPTMASLNV